MAPTSTARRGRLGGAGRSISINGRAGAGASDGDAAMRDAGSSRAGPERRVRSGQGAGPGGAAAASAKNKGTPYAAAAAAAAASRRGGGTSTGLSLSDRIRSSSNGNKPALLRDRETKGAIESLKTLIQNRWNAQAGLLNLENMASDPAFTSSKLKAPGQKGAPKNAAPALWKLVSEMCPNLQSLSLANNNLTSLVDLQPAALIRFVPKLQNLSLQNNRLAQFADLNPLSTVIGSIVGSKPGLGELKELMLTGNPLQEREMKRNAVDYQSEIRRRFPSLLMLDQVPIDQTIPVPSVPTPANGINIAGKSKRGRDDAVRSSGEAAAVAATNRDGSKRRRVELPLSMQPGFVDSKASQDAMAAFLAKFFTTFDGDRSQLIFAYAPQAHFSLSVNTAVSERARKLQHLTPEQIGKQRELSWGTYLGSAYESSSSSNGPNAHHGKKADNLSRNFVRTKSSQRREESLHTGPEAIAAFSTRLPKTTHPINDATKFVVDTWQQQGVSDVFPEVLVVAVHGEFAEEPSKANRSFDRTFVLAPAAPGTTAATAGWPCVILSDLLVLRNWTNPDVWTPQPPLSLQAGPGPASAVGNTTQQPGLADPLSALTPEQQALMAQLHAQTRLNAQFCLQCLSETGWNLQAAMQAFEAAKSSIPAEAFM